MIITTHMTITRSMITLTTAIATEVITITAFMKWETSISRLSNKMDAFASWKMMPSFKKS
jgi:hypothetical protein